MCHKLKLVLFILLYTIFINSVNAQISLGVQVGLNSAILELSNKAPEAKLSYNNGYLFGTIVNYEITKMFSLQVEPRYVQKGQRTRLDLGNIKTDTKLFYNYLELPIYLVAEFTESQFRPFILGGINMGYLLNVKAESNFNGKEETFDITDDYKKMDVAVDLGIGAKYLILQNTCILLSARYSHGIYNISTYGGTVNTRGIQLLIGVLYKL